MSLEEEIARQRSATQPPQQQPCPRPHGHERPPPPLPTKGQLTASAHPPRTDVLRLGWRGDEVCWKPIPQPSWPPPAYPGLLTPSPAFLASSGLPRPSWPPPAYPGLLRPLPGLPWPSSPSPARCQLMASARPPCTNALRLRGLLGSNAPAFSGLPGLLRPSPAFRGLFPAFRGLPSPATAGPQPMGPGRVRAAAAARAFVRGGR